MTEAELEQCVLLANWGPERTRRSAPPSRDLILRWPTVMVAARAGGRLYAAPLVTHNAPDYYAVPNLTILSRR
jgi:hypothetical protein